MTHKIAIIDDDKYNQMRLNYETDIIKLVENKYSHLVRYYKTVGSNDLSDIEKTGIVMIHDSYPDNEIKEHIDNISNEHGIHLIKFSNGITATHKTISNHSVKIELKKDRVYTNLGYFLDDFEQNGYTPDFEKLINGQNYTRIKAIFIREYLSKSLLSGYGRTLEYLIAEKSEEEKKLLELYYLAYGDSYQDHFYTFMESSNAGYKELMDECQQLLNKIKTQNHE
jgi:hypothetical protein